VRIAVLAGALATLLALPAESTAQCLHRSGGPYVVTASPTTVALSADGADFAAGQVAPPVTIRVQITPNQSWRTWVLCLRADDPTLGGYGKPIDDLVWRVAGQPSWQSISTAGSIVALGVGTAAVDVQMTFRVDAATDAAGVYGAGWTVGIAQ